MRLHLARGRLPIAAALVCGVLAIAGCGGSSKPSSAGKSTSSGGSPGLAFSKCMRSHAVPNFPDPNVAGGGFQVQVSGYHDSVSIGGLPAINELSPAFEAAISGCQKLLPGGSSPPGQQHPTAAATTLARTAAKCMRAHGVPGFPDPTAFMPSHAPASGTVDNVNGAVFQIPGSINLQSPAVLQAASACQFPGGL